MTIRSIATAHGSADNIYYVNYTTQYSVGGLLHLYRSESNQAERLGVGSGSSERAVGGISDELWKYRLF